MSRVQLISCHPPQLLPNQKIEAAHFRVWQFLEPLLRAGHEVLLCAGGGQETATPLPTVDSAFGKARVQYRHIPFGKRGWISSLQRAHDHFGPKCVVAVNFSHCLYATKLRTTRPVWMDIYGDMVTIQQAYCHRVGSNRGMPTTLAFLRRVLNYGDIFSVCGQPQRHMLVGELAMCGRLNHRTFGYEFTRVLLPGCPELPPPQDRQSVRARLGLGKDDFVVLWCGGYNTWTDVDTLFRALEWAMDRHPRLHYVSVGASTYASPDSMYARLLSRIEDSAHRHRFHMLGWQPWQEIPDYYRESDVGLNIDAMHYETIYGTRTRVVEMIAAGLPIITTTGTELSFLLERLGAAKTFEVADWRQLGHQLVELASDPEARKGLAEAALRSAQEQFSFMKTTECLQAWAQSPSLSPDSPRRAKQDRVASAQNRLRTVIRGLIWQITGTDK
ncbi:MAG: glycosyltransferase [Acidobacteria bacterium]|nr:MAG: glycosyltransferase [Acidobacteriota bacterium]